MDNTFLLTVNEVAAYLKVVPITVYRLINRGSLPAVKIGRVWRIRREDLQAYLNVSTNNLKKEQEQ